MADCNFTLIISRWPQKKGDPFTVSMDPPLQPNCDFKVSVDGQQVQPGQTVGQLRTTGLAAAGTASFEALSDTIAGTVTFTVKCGQPNPCGETSRYLQLPGPGGRRVTAWDVLKVIGVPITLILLLVGLLGWGICEVLALIFPGRNCAEIKKYVERIYGALPWN